MNVKVTLNVSKSKLFANFFIPSKSKEKVSKFRSKTVFVSCDDFDTSMVFPARVHVSAPHGNELFTYNIPKRLVPIVVKDVAKNNLKDYYTITLTADTRLP